MLSVLAPQRQRLEAPVPPARRDRYRGAQRGLTLIELLVTIAIISIVTTGIVVGSGALVNSRMRGATGMISGAVRIAFTRASATSRPSRLVFDLDASRVVLEETSDALLVRKDATGGAEATTAEEREAVEAASRIVKGPQAPRPRFRPVKALGFEDPDENAGRGLGKGVRFRRVETGHSPDGQTSGRAYLYFWPGGQTERASIQLTVDGAETEDRGMTILVSPLTGRVRTVAGAKAMDPLRDDGTSSEREDRAF